MARSAIIVGAGVFGASVAQHLSAGDWAVTLVERDEPAGPRSSSGSHSRVLRCGHGEDAWHARLAWRARELWIELGRQAASELFVQTGALWLARGEHGWEATSERVLREASIPVERLALDAAAALFPSFDPDGLAFAVLEPHAGVLRARAAVRALVALAEANGARLVHGQAHPDGGGVRIDGDRHEADAIVWACGPWLGRIFPELAPVRSERVEYATFAAGPQWAAPSTPVFVEFDAELYGLPALDGEGFKVAPEPPPVAYDPDTSERRLSDAVEQQARDYLRRRFPALADAPRVGGRVCQYESTPDSEFVLAPHPEHPHVWLLGGGSGHGFKHAPALAELLGTMLDGRIEPLARHALGPRERRAGLMWGTDSSH